MNLERFFKGKFWKVLTILNLAGVYKNIVADFLKLVVIRRTDLGNYRAAFAAKKYQVVIFSFVFWGILLNGKIMFRGSTSRPPKKLRFCIISSISHKNGIKL